MNFKWADAFGRWMTLAAAKTGPTSLLFSRELGFSSVAAQYQVNFRSGVIDCSMTATEASTTKAMPQDTAAVKRDQTCDNRNETSEP